MSIRYFSNWLKDEEQGYAHWRSSWAWLDLNLTLPSTGILRILPLLERPELASDYANIIVTADGGSLAFLRWRAALHLFNYAPLIICILGVIVNTLHLAQCWRAGNRLPACAIFIAIAAADLLGLILGPGWLAIERLVPVSLDRLHPWTCKLRYWLLGSILDTTPWLAALGMATSLWNRGAITSQRKRNEIRRMISLVLITALILNVHCLATRGWQVNGTFGTAPIVDNCGFTFGDARIFWLQLQPCFAILTTTAGPTVFVITCLLFRLAQQRGKHGRICGQKVVGILTTEHQAIRFNVTTTFFVLVLVSVLLMLPTCWLGITELFFEEKEIDPLLRALVLLSQIIIPVLRGPIVGTASHMCCSNHMATNAILGENTLKVPMSKAVEPSPKFERRRDTLQRNESHCQTPTFQWPVPPSPVPYFGTMQLESPHDIRSSASQQWTWKLDRSPKKIYV